MTIEEMSIKVTVRKIGRSEMLFAFRTYVHPQGMNETQNWLWLGLALYQAEQKNISFNKKQPMLERLIWLMNYEE